MNTTNTTNTTNNYYLLFLPVLLHKLIHPARRIHKFLLAGKERVALGTYLYADIRLSGTRVDGLAAGADNRAVLVTGMYLIFHAVSLLDNPAS